MNRRDMVLGVIFGVALLLLTSWIAGTFRSAAEQAQASNRPADNLLTVVWVGLLVVALANVAAARARIRRDHDRD